MVHGVVELIKECRVFFCTAVFGGAERFDALDENFGGFGLGLDYFEDLVDVVVERHGTGVGGLGAAHEFSLDVRRGKFDDFDVGGFELVAEGLAPGVNGGLCGAVSGGDGQGNEGQAGSDGHDGGVGLLLELGEQGRGEADGAEEVGGDDGFGVGGFRLSQKVFGAHDAGVVDDDVEGGVVLR